MADELDIQDVKRIMIVDDERDILELTKEVLILESYEVETAISGEECLRKVEEFKPDLILLDIMMPAMDGWEVFEELAERELLSDVKIALFTVKTVTEEEQKRKELVLHYIQKPFFVHYFLKEIEHILHDEN